jgi:phage gp37-like protein
MLIFAALEDAIIARVTGASESNALGYRLAHVGSYGGEFDDETFFTQFRKFPAIWLTVGGDKPRRLSARTWQCGLTVAVMVGTRNVRGERFTRRGAVGEVGSYQLLQDVRDLLAGQSLGLGISPLSLGPVRTLFNTRAGSEARSVMAVEFNADYTYQVPEPVAGNYLGIDLNYVLKPGDDVIDASDALPLSAP